MLHNKLKKIDLNLRGLFNKICGEDQKDIEEELLEEFVNAARSLIEIKELPLDRVIKKSIVFPTVLTRKSSTFEVGKAIQELLEENKITVSLVDDEDQPFGGKVRFNEFSLNRNTSGELELLREGEKTLINPVGARASALTPKNFYNAINKRVKGEPVFIEWLKKEIN